jgi:hypothetical protein
MSMPPSEKELLDRVVSKPNRAAIVLFVGEKGEVSFKELKGKLNLGVGTLYYHLDGLNGLVTQNKARQYVLAESGKKVYDAMKSMNLVAKPVRRSRFPRGSNVLREVLFFESHIERLSTDSMSSVSLTIGILFAAAVLAAMTRVEAAMFFIRSVSAAPDFAFFMLFFSWFLLLALGGILVAFLWKSRPNLLGLGTGSALALIPITFAITLNGIGKTFDDLNFLTYLYVYPYVLGFQIVLLLWAAYIYTVSLRSASSLNLEKTLVVSLLVVLVNLGYLWARPQIFLGIQ